MQISTVEGFTVIRHEMPSPIATVRVMINAGSYQEKIPGAAHFLEHMFFKGTELRGYEELNRLLAAIGSTNAFTCQDMTAFYIDTTGPRVLRAFDLLCEMMFRPALDAAEMDKERTVILEELHTRQDDPGNFFLDTSIEFLMGDKLGHEIVGTEETIGSMRVEDLMEFRAANYNFENIAFVLVGNVARADDQHLAPILAKYSARMSKGTRNVIPTLPLNLGSITDPVTLGFSHTSQQAYLSLWTPCFSNREVRDLNDAPNVLLDALGGGMHSLLFNRIREELGLAYSAGVMPMSVRENSLVGNFALLQSENVLRCKDEILTLLQKVASEGIPPAVLEASVAHFEFGCAQEAQTPASYAGTYTLGYFEDPHLQTYLTRMENFNRAKPMMPEIVQHCAARLVEGLAITMMNVT